MLSHTQGDDVVQSIFGNSFERLREACVSASVGIISSTENRGSSFRFPCRIRAEGTVDARF